MKNCLLFAAFIYGFCFPRIADAQSFSVAQDTVTGSVSTSPSATSATTIYDDIINNTASPLTLTWKVTATNFPPDWLTAHAFGACDNQNCYNNTDGYVWNETLHAGHTFTSLPYGDTTTHGPFDLSLTGDSTTTFGCYYMTVSFSSGSTTQTETFIICKAAPSAVPNIAPTESNVKIYPNPATSELNVVYDASADVKTIAVYNIIGKVMNVYKVTDNTSANLNIDNIPSGIYFVRLVNAYGEVVNTKKFTKQ